MHPFRLRRPAAGLTLSVLALMPVALPVAAQTTSGTGTPATSTAPNTPSSTSSLPPVPTAPTAPLTNGKYLLGPGDVLRVTVANYPAYNQDAIEVPPDGVLALPYFNGTVRATGKTREGVQTSLRKILSQTMIDPRVVVTVVRARSATTGIVFVNGAVMRPGTVNIRNGYRLTELLSEVGGVQGGRLEDVTATLASTKGPARVVDLHRAVSYPNSPANISVKDDDVLTVVAIVPPTVTITGDVLRPGLYEMHKTPNTATDAKQIPLTPRLSDLLVAAGLPQAALDSGQIPVFKGTLLRQAKVSGKSTTATIPLDVQAALGKRDKVADIVLQPSDVLTVEAQRPPAPIKFFVNGNGQIKTPGGYELPEGSGVLAAIAQAGGLLKLPEQTITTIVRGGQTIPINLPKLLRSADLSGDMPLQNGDIINVSEPDVIRVQVTGLTRVQAAEPLRLPLNATLQDALANAGGPTSPPQDIVINVLRRSDDGTPQILKVDPVALISRGDLTQNVKLRDGDLISVADANRSRVVFVSGEVAKQGQYTIREGDDVVDAITQAGGTTPVALLTRVMVNRGGRTLSFDTYDAVRNAAKLTSPDAKLEDGDSIVVPRNESGVVIYGAVPQQGIVPFPERKPLTVLDAISRAGGIQPNAKTQEIVLLRQGPKGQITRDFLSLAGDAKTVAYSTPLKSGDVLYVPQIKHSADGLGVAQRLLSVTGTVLAFGNIL